MTILEESVLKQLAGACKKFVSHEINWEQRRYEVAKDLLTHKTCETAEEAIEKATKFINTLKDYNNGSIRQD